MVFPWSLSDNKSPQDSRTLLSILTNLNNAVVCMVSTHYLVSKSFNTCTNTLVTVPSALITIGITVTFMFHSFFSLARYGYLSLRFFSVLRCGQLGRLNPLSEVPIFCWLSLGPRSGCLAEIRWSICISKSKRNQWVSLSKTDSGLYIYHLFEWSNLNFLPISHLISFPTESRLVFYSFCVNLLHSLITWLIISSLSKHNLHLLFCCVLNIFASTLLVLMALLCAPISRGSVSLLRFPLFSDIQVFLWEISLVCRLKSPYNCFFPIFVFLLFLLCWCLCCRYCFWSLESVFLSNFFM